MSTLILQALLLLFAAFTVSAGFGWLLAGRAMSEHSAFEKQPRAVFFENSDTLAETPAVKEIVPEVQGETLPAVAAVVEAVPEIVPEIVPETVPETSAVPEVATIVVPEDMPEDVADAVEEPTDDMDQVVKQFTSGVIVPFKMPDNSGQSAYAPPSATPKLDMVATAAVPANVTIEREDNSLQKRVSSLAGMTPESIEAAVQQVGSGLEPVRLSAPQGNPDDLTVISGVADSNQRELNALGIYHYWQIAGWSPEHVAWISNRILFPKRVVRENWMSQAARLAKLV